MRNSDWILPVNSYRVNRPVWNLYEKWNGLFKASYIWDYDICFGRLFFYVCFMGLCKKCNLEAVNRMIQTFHQRGIRISMDDFGSGYSSLNTLKDIIFDEVKIDKKFLDNEPSEKGKIVLQEIFHLLKRTRKFIVCEGVETKEMGDFLVEEGCDELQGYYYYKPLNEQDFEKSVEENGSDKILLQTTAK